MICIYSHFQQRQHIKVINLLEQIVELKDKKGEEKFHTYHNKNIPFLRNPICLKKIKLFFKREMAINLVKKRINVQANFFYGRVNEKVFCSNVLLT